VDTKAAPGAMPHEVRGDPNSTETCCEEFLYPVKEPEAIDGAIRH